MQNQQFQRILRPGLFWCTRTDSTLSCYFFQVLASMIGCMASVAALAILVIVFLRDSTPIEVTNEMTTQTCPNQTSTTAANNYFSTLNIFFNCRSDFKWLPETLRKSVNSNGSFNGTTIVGEGEIKHC